MEEMEGRVVGAFLCVMGAAFCFMAAAADGCLSLAFGQGFKLHTWAVVTALGCPFFVGIATLLMARKEAGNQ